MLERWPVRPVAGHYMQKITERTGESLYLGMRCANELLLVESTEGFGNYQLASPLGGRMPLYGCSQGKILLAYMPKKQRAEFFKTVTLKSYTPYTITDPEQLEQELEQIRAQGYAVESGELQIGLKSVAAPVFDPDGQCEYAISAVTIAGAAWRAIIFKSCRRSSSGRRRRSPVSCGTPVPTADELQAPGACPTPCRSGRRPGAFS